MEKSVLVIFSSLTRRKCNTWDKGLNPVGLFHRYLFAKPQFSHADTSGQVRVTIICLFASHIHAEAWDRSGLNLKVGSCKWQVVFLVAWDIQVPAACTERSRLPSSGIMNMGSWRTGIVPTTTRTDISGHKELAPCILKSIAWGTNFTLGIMDKTLEKKELKKVNHIDIFISGLLRTFSILMCMVNFQEESLLDLRKYICSQEKVGECLLGHL